jgi:hypothetical protein
VFEFEQHGKAFCHQPEPFCIERDDIHIWNRGRDFAEFEKNVGANANADPAVKASVIAIVESHWDCFYKAGVKK